jgi:hypothetical protein
VRATPVSDAKRRYSCPMRDCNEEVEYLGCPSLEIATKNGPEFDITTLIGVHAYLRVGTSSGM